MAIPVVLLHEGGAPVLQERTPLVRPEDVVLVYARANKETTDMSSDYNVNGEVVSTYDKSVFEDYRSKWTRDPDVEEVNEETGMVPQYEKHFPPLGEYPDEVYEATGCLDHEDVEERLSLNDEVLYWTSPPTNENAYLSTGYVRSLPPWERPMMGKPSEVTHRHVELGSGNNIDRGGLLSGEMKSSARLDLIVAINPEEA